jgi:hypothetical protein
VGNTPSIKDSVLELQTDLSEVEFDTAPIALAEGERAGLDNINTLPISAMVQTLAGSSDRILDTKLSLESREDSLAIQQTSFEAEIPHDSLHSPQCQESNSRELIKTEVGDNAKIPRLAIHTPLEDSVPTTILNNYSAYEESLANSGSLASPITVIIATPTSFPPAFAVEANDRPSINVDVSQFSSDEPYVVTRLESPWTLMSASKVCLTILSGQISSMFINPITT